MKRPDPAHPSFQLLGVAVFAITAVQCASVPRDAASMPENGLVAYSAAELDQQPRLIRCSEVIGPLPSNISGTRWEIVTVRFIVTENGTVDPASVFPTRSDAPHQGVPASNASIEEAQHRAQTCRYKPGRLDGQVVRATMERTFRVLAQS